MMAYEYHVDANDQISHVSESWLAFAQANGCPELTREAVVGNPLWLYVDGIEVKALYMHLFEKVRDGGQSVRIPFNCDSPELRRFMRLDIVPRDKGALNLTGVLLREEQRSEVRLFDASAPRSTALLYCCSWCKRIKVTESNWVSVEDAIRDAGLFDSATMPRLSHGICPECACQWK